MPLIQPEKKTTNEQLNVTLSSETLHDLRAYARFLNNSSVSYVLTQLIATLGRDKEFQQWKLTRAELRPETLIMRSEKGYAVGKSASAHSERLQQLSGPGAREGAAGRLAS